MTTPGIDPDPARRIADPEWMAIAWYGQTLGWLCASQGLLPLSPERGLPGALAELPGAASGHLAACSPELALETNTTLARHVVVGGPCLGDCMRGPTLEALYDTLATMLAAKALGAEALLYLGDREEALGAGGEGKWLQLGERFERWLRVLGEHMELARLTVVRTSSAAHEAALAAAGNPAQVLARERIDRAFQLGNGPLSAGEADADSPQEERARRVTERVIEAHLPEVVARHVGRAAPVLMTENLPQAGVFALARELATRGPARAGGEQPGGETISYLGHFPAPGPSARNRMYRSEGWDKVPASELETVTRGAPGLHPYARQFYACWLTPELRRAAADAARAW